MLKVRLLNIGAFHDRFFVIALRRQILVQVGTTIVVLLQFSLFQEDIESKHSSTLKIIRRNLYHTIFVPCFISGKQREPVTNIGLTQFFGI